MYPRYDAYHDQRSQMPYPYDYPTFHIPSQMRVNPLSHFPPAAYEPWSYYGGNYGYRIPNGYNYFPPYHSSGYPHPYHPPPLPYFHDASCAPTTFYSMELPTDYDYDKKPNGRCPYHLCCWGGDTTKEKEPDAEKSLTGERSRCYKGDINHCKLIPVKQLDEPENELAKNNPEGGYKRSKLPPVCLRVEPISRRKDGSGKMSRSLSPPKRGKPEEMITESSATMGLKEDIMKSAREHEQCKLSQIADAKTNQSEMPFAGKELTEMEAAVMIQAAYRGYEVRKWEPIKKLKELGKVKEELNMVKSRMKAMEFSSSYSSSDKEICLLGEMIMNLLLKLDTIQGLDPVTRDVRKSTAKELVNLQEQVDSAVNNNKEDVNKEKEEEKEVTAFEEAAQAGVTDHVAAKEEDEEEEKEKVIALEEVAESTEKEVEALMGDADNGGASDEGLGTEIELKEEEEEEKVRLIMEQLVEKGKEQLEVIRELSERIVMLEKKLATTTKKKKAGDRARTKTRTRKCNLK